MGFTSHSKWYVDMKNFLSGVVAASSLYGYISKSKAREINENNNKTIVEATCDLTIRLMSSKNVEEDWKNIYKSDDTNTFVEEALEWIQNMDADNNSYFENLKVICSNELVELKHIGYAASFDCQLPEASFGREEKDRSREARMKCIIITETWVIRFHFKAI